MGISMSVKLGIVHKFHNSKHEVAPIYWDGVYAVTNIEEPDWKAIDDLIKRFQRSIGLELHIRFNVDCCENQKQPP